MEFDFQINTDYFGPTANSTFASAGGCISFSLTVLPATQKVIFSCKQKRVQSATNLYCAGREQSVSKPAERKAPKRTSQLKIKHVVHNENTVQRIREFFQQKNMDFHEKEWHDGVWFFVNENRCCGTEIDKETGKVFLLCEISFEKYLEVLKMKNVIPFKGYVLVTEEGYKSTEDLNYWLQLCLDFQAEGGSWRK